MFLGRLPKTWADALGARPTSSQLLFSDPQHSRMASNLALQNFPGFSKEAIPQDWFPRGEEVTNTFI